MTEAQVAGAAATRREVTGRPYNAETPLEVLDRALTPPGLCYVRNHFDIPALDPEEWRLEVTGEVKEPRPFSLSELRDLEERTAPVTLECAGNGRRSMSPRPPGTPWGWGAVATAEFTGVPLPAILDRVRPRAEVREVLFVGGDAGEVASGETVPFARSLPMAEARRPDVLLAWGMHGTPLAREHGAPLRLVVPGWYAMASVKWLVRIELLTEPFGGFFQRDRYVYEGEDGLPEGAPVTRMRPRALIARPREGARLPSGEIEVAGTAWSGNAGVSRVEVSVDGGETWREAELGRPAGPGAAVPWRLAWSAPPGRHEVVARAVDAAGATQPLESRRNRLGYGNNVVHRVRVEVADNSG